MFIERERERVSVCSMDEGENNGYNVEWELNVSIHYSVGEERASEFWRR